MPCRHASTSAKPGGASDTSCNLLMIGAARVLRFGLGDAVNSESACRQFLRPSAASPLGNPSWGDDSRPHPTSAVPSTARVFCGKRARIALDCTTGGSGPRILFHELFSILLGNGREPPAPLFRMTCSRLVSRRASGRGLGCRPEWRKRLSLNVICRDGRASGASIFASSFFRTRRRALRVRALHDDSTLRVTFHAATPALVWKSIAPRGLSI